MNKEASGGYLVCLFVVGMTLAIVVVLVGEWLALGVLFLLSGLLVDVIVPGFIVAAILLPMIGLLYLVGWRIIGYIKDQASEHEVGSPRDGRCR